MSGLDLTWVVWTIYEWFGLDMSGLDLTWVVCT